MPLPEMIEDLLESHDCARSIRFSKTANDYYTYFTLKSSTQLVSVYSLGFLF